MRVGNGGTGSKPTAKIRSYNLLYTGATLVSRTMVLDEALDSLESELRFQIARLSQRRLFVHAGVVGWNGSAVVIPGRSFSGKTSLVAALVRAGATYYSDEYAVFDSRGLVHPYPKPLNLRANGGRAARKCPVEELGGRCGTKPLPVGLIIVSDYQRGARWRPRNLSPGEAVLALLAHTVRAQVAPSVALSILRQATRNAQARGGKRGEAAELIRRLLQPAGPHTRTKAVRTRETAAPNRKV